MFTTMLSQTQPYSLTCEEGRGLCSFRTHRTQVVVKATSEQTGGEFSLFEVTWPSGYATSLNIHYAEDVAIYVLEGALTVFWGSEKREAVTGSYFYQPRGIPHGFRVQGTTPARLLYLTFPAGLDRFIIEQAQFAPDCESMTAAAHYKIEILGPLPE